MKCTFKLATIFILVALSCQAQQTTRLVIRGDDMGYAHSGNEALIKSYKDGIERSVEIIVPAPWFPEAVKMLQENPGIDVGVHLALTSEWDNVKWRPLTDCKSLLDEDGYFLPMTWPNKNYPGKAIVERKFLASDIEKEFRAQIAMALKKLPLITHISGHMGCTNLNDTIKVLSQKLAKEYKIDIDLEERDVQTVSYDGPHKTSAEKINSFIAMLQKLGPGKTYMFLDHPGLDTPELHAIHHIGYENVAEDRQGVTDLFTSKEVKAALQKNNIQVISYADIGAARQQQ